MKHFYLLLAACSFAITAHSQISLTQADFANAGDQILVSNGDISIPADITTSGANQTWDFSYLTPQSQDTISYLNVTNTGTTYALYFANVGFNSNRSNIAVSGGVLPAIPGLPITLSDPYSFFYKSNTDYRQQGLGISISGFGTPIAYSNKDILYIFPVNYNNADSCNSDWNFSLSGLGYYGYTQKRVNHVDGWGTVITPYGSFNSLRIRTEIYAKDTLFADTLGFGFSFDRPKTVEYKWFTNNEKIPVLQINTTDVTGNEVVTSIVYRDTLQNVGVNNLAEESQSIAVFPNPAKDYVMVNIVAAKTQHASLKLFDAKGSLVLSLEDISLSSGNNTKLINTHLLHAGIYTLQFITELGNKTAKVIIQ